MPSGLNLQIGKVRWETMRDGTAQVRGEYAQGVKWVELLQRILRGCSSPSVTTGWV